jgi:hypothetical protein
MTERAWHNIIDPIAAKFEVAAALGLEVHYNAEGSKALANLLRKMARIIDDEIERRKAAPEQAPPRP